MHCQGSVQTAEQVTSTGTVDVTFQAIANIAREWYEYVPLADQVFPYAVRPVSCALTLLCGPSSTREWTWGILIWALRVAKAQEVSWKWMCHG